MFTIQYYDEMLKLSRELRYYSSLASLLSWDTQTYMPPKASDFRSQQSAFIAEKVNLLMTGDKTKALMKNLTKTISELDTIQKRNIILFEREYTRRTAIPNDILIENVKQESLTFSVWQHAKRKNDYESYAPELAKNIANKQKMASYISPTKTAFDVYLDEFEPGFSSDKISSLFDQLKPKLLSLLHKIHQSEVKIPDSINVSMDHSDQEKLVQNITKFIGYDIKKGSIDSGEHPMTIGMGSPNDVRFTVNYDENNYLSALFAGLHEAGHAIHGQNSNPEYNFQPIGLFGGSAGISESQSRFFENIVGRSVSFWSYYFSKLPASIQKIGLSNFVHLINKVQLSKIRIQADEVTYPLHIILRFEIEKGLLDGSISVNELPAIWNEKINAYFNLDVNSDTEGVMQVIHWATGFYGYFPTYALGNIYNAQMYYAMKKVLDFETLLEHGSIEPIRNWLVEHVHSKTGLYDPEEFIRRITHEDVNSTYFIKYLEEKYSKLYELN